MTDVADFVRRARAAAADAAEEFARRLRVDLPVSEDQDGISGAVAGTILAALEMGKAVSALLLECSGALNTATLVRRMSEKATSGVPSDRR